MGNYIAGKIYGLPTPKRTGHNTSRNKQRLNLEYVFKVKYRTSYRFKVHVGRSAGGVYKSKIKYFKTIEEALLFRDFLRENKYL
jgi:hypothetical protein